MRILFLFIGEPHHLLHALPIAAELRDISPETDIHIAIASEEHLSTMERVMAVYPSFREVPFLLNRGPFSNIWHWLCRGRHQSRLLTLFQNLPFLRSFDAIIVPERTTTIIRHFLSKRTRLIFTPHGAGDRAIMLDPRDRLFDFVLVAGKKSERRLLEAGTIHPGRYAVNGYVKMDFMQRVAQKGRRIFDNERPTVVYAPHFRPSLSSWPLLGKEIIRAFAAQEQFNLVVAPHMRLFHDAPRPAKSEIEALAVPDKILIDLDSHHLTDMTYMIAADIYLGDVSSQVYEFLGRPRPCVFVNAHGVEWQGDPNYFFWTLGDIGGSVPSVMTAIARAQDRHPLFIERQRAALAESIGDDPTGAAQRGAEAIRNFLSGQVC